MHRKRWWIDVLFGAAVLLLSPGAKADNRALELKPDLAQAYMYRGVLFTSMGDYASASIDHAKLLVLDQELAVKLERIIAGGRDDDGGLAGLYD